MVFINKERETVYRDGKVSAVTLKSNIKEVREWLLHRVMNMGVKVRCPVCTQVNQLYSRTIYREMALYLEWLYNNEGRHDPSAINKGVIKVNPDEGVEWRGQVELSKLSYWGLTDWEQVPKTTAHWITEKGRKFVEGKIMVPRVAAVFQGRVRGFSGEDVDFIYCLGREPHLDKWLDPQASFPRQK